MSRPNWGVPDWRDAAAYESDRSLRQWRWEFLRRRQDYREDWRMHYEPSLREKLAIYKEIPLPEGVFSWEEHLSGFATYPDSAWKYGIAPMIDPSRTCSEFELWQAAQNEHPRLLRFASRERFDEMEATGHVIVEFDLNKPLPQQLSRVERRLKRTQAEMLGTVLDRRHHQKKWPVYLRVIDARDAGEKLRTIGFHVFGRIVGAEQQVRDTLEQARGLKL